MTREELERIWDEMGIVDGEPRPFTAREMRDRLNAVLLPRLEVTGATSDGFHTFDELYQHRMVLTAALMKSHPGISWRSLQHHESGEPMFDGFFIVGMELPTGMITYHYKLEHWRLFDGVDTIDNAPEWDGHTPADVVRRFSLWSQSL